MAETVLDDSSIFSVSMPAAGAESHPALDVILDEIGAFQGGASPDWVLSIHSAGRDIDGSEIGLGYRLVAEIEAMPSSPYAFFKHTLELRFPDDYPEHPIFVRFLSCIHHELVLNYGDLKDFFYSKVLKWQDRKSAGIIHTLMAIRAILVARLPDGFDITANEIKRYWLDYSPEKLSLKNEDMDVALRTFREFYCKHVHKQHDQYVKITRNIINIQKNYKRMHKQLFINSIDEFEDEWLAPDLLEFLKDPSDETAKDVFEEVGEGSWNFEIFDRSYANKLIAELARYKNTQFAKVSSDTLMGSKRIGSVVPSHLGLDAHMRAIFEKVIKPVSKFLYKDEHEYVKTLDHFHAFMINKCKNMGTPPHIDDSEITLNICLGGNFEDGHLALCGMFGDQKHLTMQHIYTQTPLYAILHHGKRRHKAFAVTSGERANLIFWARSSEYRRKGKLFELRRCLNEEKIHNNCY